MALAGTHSPTAPSISENAFRAYDSPGQDLTSANMTPLSSALRLPSFILCVCHVPVSTSPDCMLIRCPHSFPRGLAVSAQEGGSSAKSGGISSAIWIRLCVLELVLHSRTTSYRDGSSLRDCLLVHMLRHHGFVSKSAADSSTRVLISWSKACFAQSVDRSSAAGGPIRLSQRKRLSATPRGNWIQQLHVIFRRLAVHSATTKSIPLSRWARKAQGQHGQ